MTSVIPLNTDKEEGERKQEELGPARLWRRSEAGRVGADVRERKEGTFWMELKKKKKAEK